MSQGNADQQLGALDARMTFIEQAMLRMDQKLDGRLERLEVRVGVVHDAMTAAKGGWRVLAALGVIVAALGAVAGWFLNLIFGRH